MEAKDQPECHYCHSPNVVFKCVCGKYFCNQRIKGAMECQIMYHLKEMGHYAVYLCQHEMACSFCGKTQLCLADSESINNTCSNCRKSSLAFIGIQSKKLKCCKCEETNIYGLMYNESNEGNLNEKLYCRSCKNKEEAKGRDFSGYSNLIIDGIKFHHPGVKKHGNFVYVKDIPFEGVKIKPDSRYLKKSYASLKDYAQTYQSLDYYEFKMEEFAEEVTLRREKHQVQLNNVATGRDITFTLATSSERLRQGDTGFFCFGGDYGMIQNESLNEALTKAEKIFSQSSCVFDEELFNSTKIFRLITVSNGREYRNEIFNSLYKHARQIPFLSVTLGQEEMNGIITTKPKNAIKPNKLIKCKGLDLGQKQEEAILKALNNNFSLIYGPPGTGKTEVAVQIVDNLVKVKKCKKIIATAASNTAVDCLAERFVEKNIKVVRVVNESGLENLSDNIRKTSIYHRAHSYAKSQGDEEIEKIFFKKFKSLVKDEQKTDYQKLKNRFENSDELQKDFQTFEKYLKEKSKILFTSRKYIEGKAVIYRKNKGVEIIQTVNSVTKDESFKMKDYIRDNFKAIVKGRCCICITLGSIPSYARDLFEYDYAVIDEAAQALELQTLNALIRVNNVVLIGDSQQLNPTVRSKEARRAGYEMSLFERLFDRNIPRTLLNTQYRMNPEIANFCSVTFYSGQLRNGYNINSRIDDRLVNFFPNPKVPIVFIESNGREHLGESGHSFGNEEEKHIAGNILQELRSKGIADHEIGIISPYSTQRDLLEGIIGEVQVANIDGFQGNEKEFIIFSCARSNDTKSLGFLADYRRINVALSHFEVHGDSDSSDEGDNNDNGFGDKKDDDDDEGDWEDAKPIGYSIRRKR
ncbi:Upf1 domain-containing protein [Entamoeba marina]